MHYLGCAVEGLRGETDTRLFALKISEGDGIVLTQEIRHPQGERVAIAGLFSWYPR
jgi:hypothetical protein